MFEDGRIKVPPIKGLAEQLYSKSEGGELAFQILRLLASRHHKNGEPCGSFAKVEEHRFEASSRVVIVRDQEVRRMAVNFAQCFIAVAAGDEGIVY